MGVIIGAAFGKIVDSIVNDLVMPIVGRGFGGLDFANYFLPLREVPAGTAHTLDAVRKAGVPVFAYGSFITICLNFAILAFIIFLMVKQFNRLEKAQPPPPPAGPPEEVSLLREIRDAPAQVTRSGLPGPTARAILRTPQPSCAVRRAPTRDHVFARTGD